jgi:hypothetical protein
MTAFSVVQASPDVLALQWFRQSEGMWHSQRRYYTLNPKVATQEVVSLITVQVLVPDSPQLLELAQLHQLEANRPFVGGSYVTWESDYTGQIRKPSTGSTIFGIREGKIFRDRGFATTQPVTASFSMINPHTLTLRTEYQGSVFEEELKLIGSRYRTRQTIISRAGEEIMIGQYLETRVD